MSASAARLTDSGRRAIGLGGSVLAAIGWGFGAIFATLASAPGLVLTFYRLWLGAVLLVDHSCTSRAAGSAGGRYASSWFGGIFLGGDMAMFFSAVKLTSVVNATVISAVQPAIVLIAARRLFGERMGRWDVFWIVVAMGGVAAAVVGPGVTSRDELLGDLLAVGALFSWSAYWLVSKHARAEQNALEYTAGVTIVAALMLTVIVPLSRQSLGQVESGDWLWIGLLAVVPGTAHLLMNWATVTWTRRSRR